MPSPTAAARLRPRLLRWYARSARPLPWRQARACRPWRAGVLPSRKGRRLDPYRVWVAETMLQQTTIAAVLPRYEKFLKRFPDLRALARCRESEVLRAWAGLGYYARARNLREAARRIVAEDGRFPRDMGSIVDLPGVGRYTAAAVLSIAFGQPYAVLDGNVARVLCRLFAIRAQLRRPATQDRLTMLAQHLLAPHRPGDWNQAMMELGETVCIPGKPRCGDCPVSTLCLARKKGLQDRLPLEGAREKAKNLRWDCLWIERGGRVLLCLRDRDELLLKGHWGLPEAGRLRARPGAPLKTVRHAITRYRLTIRLHQARLIGPRPPRTRWVRRDRLKDFLISSLWLKLLPG